MDLKEIDWEAMWREVTAAAPWRGISKKELWEKQADEFSQRIVRVKAESIETDKDDYISNMLRRIEVEPAFTVLDIGCGPGTLTIPLAKRVGSVTALDISERMLENLRANAANEDVANIRYINAAWEDAFARNQVAKHDVVVASRSLSPVNIGETFSRLAAVARHAVYFTTPIVHLPFDWEVYRAIGRNRVRHPSYIYIINALYQMGIQANLEILYSRIRVHFPTVEEAVADLQWRTTPFSDAEKAKLIAYLEPKFAEHNGTLTHEGKSKWALIWWKIKDNALFGDS